MAQGDVWRLSFVGSHSGTEIAVITMHISMKTANGNPVTAGQYIRTNLIELLKTQQSTTWRWDYCQGLLINRSPHEAIIDFTNYPQAGTQAQGEMPHQVALVVTTRTAYAGRSYRGRNYIPALAQTAQSAGLFTNTVTDAVQTYYDDLVAGIGANGSHADYMWVVWSDRLQQGNGVTDTVVRTVPGIIRRRRVGVGV